jgi:RNA polymerase sigma factor (sigma-70 family)
MAASFGFVLSQIQRWTSGQLGELSDAVLLERFVQGRDESAFTALVARHGEMVLHSCRRILGNSLDAEDAFQATFLILARRAHTLRQPSALPGFLHSVARRTALKARIKSACLRGNTPLDEEMTASCSDPLAQLSARELLEIIDEEVARLPSPQRSAVVLCCLEGQTRQEAARILGWTPISLKGHLQRGRQRLQARLNRRGIALSAALAVVAVSHGEAASALLLRSTATAALSGGIGSSAAALAHSVLKEMLLTKLAGAMTVVLTIALAVSTTVAVFHRGPTAQAPEDKKPAVLVGAKKSAASKPVRKDVWGDPLPPRAIARLGSLRLYHGAVDVRQVVLSPDGKLVASTDDKGFNKLWDVPSGRELPLAKHLDRAFLFAANGKLLGAEQQGNRLWDAATGKNVSAECIDIVAARRRKEPGRREILSPDGTILAVVDDKQIRLLDARTRKELPPLQGQPKEGVWPPCFSPDGKLLAVPYVNPVPGVRLWDLAIRKEARWLRGKDYQIFDVAFSGHGKIVAAADGGGVTLWDAATGEWIHDPGHTYYVGALAFTPDGKTLLTGSGYNDRFLRLWDPFTGRPRGKWTGHEWGILAVLVTADGKRVISTSQDGTIRLWDFVTGKEIGRIGEGKRTAWDAALSPDGKLLATASQGIQLWDFATRRQVRSFGKGTALHLAFSPDGTKLASSASRDASVHLWNVANGEEIRSFKGFNVAGDATKAGFSPDERTLATSNSDGTIVIWDLLTGKELRRLGQPLKPGPRSAYVLGAMTFSPDGRVVAVGYSDQTVRLLEVATGKERACYRDGHRSGIYSVAFSPDGRLLASGSWDRTVMVWDVTERICADKTDRIVLDAKAQERYWADLADGDAAKAYQAMQVLRDSEQTIDLLRKRLYPAAAIDAQRLNRLVADLDSDDFAMREKASQNLTALGDRAEPVLRKALPTASAEARRRIEDILKQIDPSSSTDLQRRLRALEVLEWIGTVDAQRLLKTLAQGDPPARLTCEAKAALERLAKRDSNRSP